MKNPFITLSFDTSLFLIAALTKQAIYRWSKSMNLYAVSNRYQWIQQAQVLIALSIMLALLGCDSTAQSRHETALDAGLLDQNQYIDMVSAIQHHNDMNIDASIEPQRVPRKLRRMSLDQLAKTIPLLTNGIRWTEDFGQGEVDILQLLAPTFGAPDYLTITEENLEPSLLISKFLNDASKRVCLKRLQREEDLSREWQALMPMNENDWQRPEVKAILDQQVLVKGDFYLNDENHIKAQLQRLILLFLGDQLPQEHPRFQHYWALFQLVQQSSPQQPLYWGYFSVCVGLFNDPEFLLY